MSDQLERVVKYKPPLLKMVFMGWASIVPVLTVPLLIISAGLFCLVIPVIIFGFIESRELGFFSKVMYQLPLVLLVSVSSLAAVLLITAVMADDQIHFTNDGVVFPLFLSPFMRFRRKRLWSEIVQVYIDNFGGADTTYGDIVLVFRSGERLKLDMAGFVDIGMKGFLRGDLEKFLLATELLCQGAEISPEIKQLRDHLGNESREIGQLSYTEVWERELSNRFHATVFVPLEPGAVLQDGRLKVIRQLAFGGLAAVYLVQRNGRELIILKEALIPASQDESLKTKALELFAREARYLTRLEHPRIAKVYDHFVEGGRNYLLLERVSGCNLRQVVNQRGPQQESKVLVWVREVAEILVYLHEQQPAIIHRDLTPENLILSDSERVHLIDFGAANEFLGTVTGTVVGKHAFISPEQFRGKADPSSDIYAFGCTMHYLLTGKDPVAMSVQSPKAFRGDISEETDHLVRSCTAQDSKDRPESARILLSLIEKSISASRLLTG
ncbi:MAG: serine/threonine protein kinase [Candidatus Obscuribacterales bacterium]|nr:serine/threonine protein kinase [Candidatus Obscuribacterales bacterium]